MTNTKELEQIFDDVLSPRGFRKRKDTWYRRNEDTITLVNLQKSQWGGRYYVNLGVYLRDLGRETSPPEHRCHIRARLSGIAPERQPAIEESLDLERAQTSPTSRAETLRSSLEQIALPFLDERSVIPTLRRLHGKGQLDRGSVTISKAARDLLEKAPG